VSFFKTRRKLGPTLLGIWLIASGLAHLIHLSFAYMDPILAGLAIAAGVLVLIDR
jgi:hypothetical protein